MTEEAIKAVLDGTFLRLKPDGEFALERVPLGFIPDHLSRAERQNLAAVRRG